MMLTQPESRLPVLHQIETGRPIGNRRMNLAAFVSFGPVSSQLGGWRCPATDTDILAIRNQVDSRSDGLLPLGDLGSLRLGLPLSAGATRHLGAARPGHDGRHGVEPSKYRP